MEFESKSLEETAEIARNFAKNLKKKREGALVIGLYGELGSGKTTFMKYLTESLGVKETIQSPTFVIMKKYKIQNSDSDFQFLTHIDAYRIEKKEEALVLDWLETISNSDNLVFIEWPERIAELMPGHTKIFFKHGENNSERKIIINE